MPGKEVPNFILRVIVRIPGRLRRVSAHATLVPERRLDLEFCVSVCVVSERALFVKCSLTGTSAHLSSRFCSIMI